MTHSILSRRKLVKLLAGSAAALPLAPWFPRLAHGQGAAARRVIFFYVPDGMHRADWGLAGQQLAALGAMQRRCVLLYGINMDRDPNAQGHNDGAKKLLKGDMDPNGTSFDQYLAGSFGASSFYQHLYLGAQAGDPRGANGDDWFISYKNGQKLTPEDNPAAAFARLFPGGQVPSAGLGGDLGESAPHAPNAELARHKSILDVVLAELNELRGKLDRENQRKLDVHLEATREAERRIELVLATGETPGGTGGPPSSASGQCGEPVLSFGAEGSLHDATRFPEVLSAQIDVMVTAMACGLTRVGTLQCSRHTSPLSMPFGLSRTMQSHEASHNDQSVFLEQRVWFMKQFKLLLERLAAREDPDVGGSMLDHTLVLLCTEIDWGPEHLHTDMPFVLAGGTGGALQSGREFRAEGRLHADLMASIAQALGASASGWLGGNHRPLEGLAG